MSASISANDLPIAGLIPFSATDWPGRLTATVFTQGCPLRCTYCHNPQLQQFRPGTVSWHEVTQLIDARRGLLDALVISGGEPVSSPALPAAIRAAHALGFPVGLHTSGYAPHRLRRLLADPETRPDWIGLDIKGLPPDLPPVVGCTPRVAEAMWESLAAVVASGVETQVRTTVWPGSALEAHLPYLQERVADYGASLVVQSARGCDASGFYLNKTVVSRA